MTDLRNRDARRSRWLAAAIAADLLLVVMQAVACAMYRAPHTGDAQSYWELALYCAQNHTFYPSPRDEFALYIFGNGYVNLLSLLLRLRETYAWVYAVNMAFTQLLVFSVYRIMRRLCEGREAACAAVTLLCLLPALWGEAASSRTELCFMGLAFASLACAMEDGTGWHALSGVLMALCNWVRPLMVILLPMTLLLLILRKKRLRCIAAYLLGAAAVIATIGQATKSLSGHFIYQAQTMGVNMLMGNNDDADGSYDNTVFGEGKIGYISEDERGVTYQVRDAFYKRQAVDWIVRHIPRFVQLIPRKLFYFLSTDTYGGTPYLGGDGQPAVSAVAQGYAAGAGRARLCLRRRGGDLLPADLYDGACAVRAGYRFGVSARHMGADAAVLGHFRAGLRHCGADGRRAALPHAVSADLRDGSGGLSPCRAGRRG